MGEAKTLVESAPCAIKEGMAKADAEAIKKAVAEAVEKLGGKVTLKCSSRWVAAAACHCFAEGGSWEPALLC